MSTQIVFLPQITYHLKIASRCLFMIWAVIKENCSSSLNIITALLMTWLLGRGGGGTAEQEVERGHHCPCSTGGSGRAPNSAAVQHVLILSQVNRNKAPVRLPTDPGDATPEDACLGENSAPRPCCKAKLHLGPSTFSQLLLLKDS